MSNGLATTATSAASPVMAHGGQAQGQMRSDQLLRLASNQFLTFLLGGQDFGVEILQVREIRNFTKLTPIPNMPASIKGVLNLRGTVVPIVDLRIRLGMPAVEYDRFTVIIVVNVNERVMGVVVDAVSDVLNVDGDALVAPPEMGNSTDTSFVTGLAKSEDRLVTLLNFQRLLDVDSPIGKS